MSDEYKPYNATNANIIQFGLAPAMRWLIATALDGDTVTYGWLRDRLERDAGFSKIFTTRIGFFAGELMFRLQNVDPSAPLINVLVVNQADGMPSKGAGDFMAKRFNEPRLSEPDAKQKYPDLWESSFRRAAGEVYAYPAERWAKLYAAAFGEDLAPQEIEQSREARSESGEEDGIPKAGRLYGAGGESEFHKSLRLWIRDNPTSVDRRFAGARCETEFDLYSGDRVDAAYFCTDRTVLIEVKSRLSNFEDLRRGVFQCIKYRAVAQAMDVRRNAPIEAYLVTEEVLPGEIARLCHRHSIKHFLAPKDRQK